MKYKRGISLVALVITVIIMLIMAGISYNAIFGDNGVISQAMKSKEKTENAAVKEVLELAWAARMSKFYEDISLGKPVSFASYFSPDALNDQLGSSGKILGVKSNEEDNYYLVMYQDSKGNNYEIRMESDGKADVIDDHMDSKTVNEKLASESYTLATGVTVEEPEETSKDKKELYGKQIITGVDKIGGVDTVTDNWKVFYIDDSNVYLIYGDWYPAAGLQNTGDDISGGYGDYAILTPTKQGVSHSERREILINYFKNSDNWTNITEALSSSGTFSGKVLETTGTPTLEMWLDSWNEKYDDILGRTSVTEGTRFNYYDFETNDYYPETREEDNYLPNANGLIVSRYNNTTPVWYSYKLRTDFMETKEGYQVGGDAEGNIDNLYYPRKQTVHSGFFVTSGYCLATLSAENTDGIYTVYCSGHIQGSEYYSFMHAFRPVVKISIQDFKEATGEDWN